MFLAGDYNFPIRALIDNVGCAVCLRKRNVFSCKKCLAVTYCCERHRLLDDAFHYRVCPAVRFIRLETARFRRHRNKELYHTTVASYLNNILRDLLEYSTFLKLAHFPSLCAVCLSGMAVVKRRHHIREWEITYWFQHFVKGYRWDIRFAPEESENIVALTKTLDITKIFKISYNKIPSSEAVVLTTEQEEICARVTVAHVVRIALNILRGLQELDVKESRAFIHIVSFDDAEIKVQWDIITHIILYFIKEIRYVYYYITNVDSVYYDQHYHKPILTPVCCVQLCPVDYSVIVRSMPRPHLVCMFNWPFSGSETWIRSLPLIIQKHLVCVNSPGNRKELGLLCTSFFYGELECVKSIMNTIAPTAAVVVDISENKFADVLPLRHPSIYTQLLYRYKYIFIVKSSEIDLRDNCFACC